MTTTNKIFFIIAAVILIALTITALSTGIYFLTGGQMLSGIGCIVASLITGYASYLLYDNYKHKKNL